MTPDEYRGLRRSIGTQSQVAERLGVHPQTISQRERGVLEIDDEAALAIRRLSDEARTLEDAAP